MHRIESSPCVAEVTDHARRPATELPLRYYDGASVLAYLAVPRDAAESLIDREHYRLGLHWRGSAIVGMGFYDFRVSALGPYREVGIAVPVVPRGHAGPSSDVASLAEVLRPARWRRAGLHVLDLPVTTEPARAAGADHWGYPKFVTRIEWRERERHLECEVGCPVDSGRMVVRLSGRTGRGLPVPSMDQVLYSDHDGRRLRTEIAIGGRTTLHRGRDLRLEVGTSEHGMAARLRALGLDGASPLVVMRVDKFTSVLPAGVPVA